MQQSSIINKMVQQLELETVGTHTNLEKSIQTSQKVKNVIDYLIKKENVIMIAQDSKVKNERFLCLNINVDLQNMNLGN